MASLERNQPFNAEFRLVRQDGSLCHVRATARIIRDAGGRPTRMIGTNLEITAQKQAEEALRENASLLDLCHEAILVRDLDGTISFWNEGAEEVYGFKKDQAVGQVSHQLLRTVFPLPLAEIEQVFLERERWEGELHHTTESGKPVFVDSRWALKRDKKGRRNGVMEINSDITERRQAEEALRRSAEQEQLLISGVKDYSIIMLDPQGNVTTWNEGAKQIKGYESEEIIGRHASVFYPPELIAEGRPDHVLNAARAEGSFQEMGWRVRKDGSLFWANIVITALFDAAGNLRGYCKITRDITEYKRVEEATDKARLAADLANRAKSDFLANMSHEVRTPVNAIMGMAHLALRANPQPRQKEYLVKIDTAAKRLLGIMNDILDFSKIEAGKLQLECIQFALSEVLQSLRDVVEHKANEKKLQLIFSVSPDVPAHLSGDPLRLGQVLINLVNNAIKFTAQGEVRLTVERLNAGEEAPCLRFAVADTGIGMTAPQMENLFQAFHQADTSFTRQYGGTGLGLAISKQLVEMMGGSIKMQSEFGAGSTFTFTAQFGHAARTASKTCQQTPAPHGSSRILVVDDSETTRDELVQLLRHHGQLAQGTDSGEQALSTLIAGAQRGEPFHLVVMDWRLPGMNGIEASRRIRHHTDLQPTPIILMISAFDRHDVAPASEPATFDGFLLKPVKEDSFLQAVWSLLDSRREGKPPAAVPDATALAGRKVLLVEDNDLNRDVATELLTDFGVTVTVALDGQSAVDMVHSHPFDLVLMDIQMPVMDGLTATRTIRADSRFAALPIIAMTAHAMTGDYDRSLAAGMNDHITKPIDPELLARALVRWMPAGTTVAREVTAPVQGALPEQLLPFNLAAALLRTNNKPLLLLKLLLGFKQQYAGAANQLRAFLVEEKWAEAQRLVHSLKSIAGMLETSALANAAGAIEAALRSGQRTGLEPLMDDLDATLRPAIDAVASLDQGAPALAR